jgi:hypothetical protein
MLVCYSNAFRNSTWRGSLAGRELKNVSVYRRVCCGLFFEGDIFFNHGAHGDHSAGCSVIDVALHVTITPTAIAYHT